MQCQSFAIKQQTDIMSFLCHADCVHAANGLPLQLRELQLCLCHRRCCSARGLPGLVLPHIWRQPCFPGRQAPGGLHSLWQGELPTPPVTCHLLYSLEVRSYMYQKTRVLGLDWVLHRCQDVFCPRSARTDALQSRALRPSCMLHRCRCVRAPRREGGNPLARAVPLTVAKPWTASALPGRSQTASSRCSTCWRITRPRPRPERPASAQRGRTSTRTTLPGSPRLEAWQQVRPRLAAAAAVALPGTPHITSLLLSQWQISRLRLPHQQSGSIRLQSYVHKHDSVRDSAAELPLCI